MPSATASAPPAVEPPAEKPPAPQTSRTERLAGKLSEGWIVFDPPTKRFVAVTSFAEEGNGVGIVGVVVPTDETKSQFFTLCEPEDNCVPASEGLDEANIARIDDWLGERSVDKALAIEPAEFTDEKVPTAALPALAAQLVWRSGQLEFTRNKKTTKLAKLVVDKEFTPRPFRVAASPDAKHLCVLYELDPGANYAKGFNLHVEAITYAVPTN